MAWKRGDPTPPTQPGVNYGTPQSNLYDPYGIVTTGSAAQMMGGTPTGQTTNESWLQSPEFAAVYAQLMGLGLNDAQARATIQWYYDEQNKNIEYNKWSTQATLAESLAEAKLAAASGDARAQMSANAQLQAAQIAADTALQTSQLDAETRLKISAAEIADRMQARIAEQTARPSDWPYQIALLKGQNRATAPRTGVAAALGPPGVQGNQAFQQFQQQAPQAIVGEAGPELATATPQGTVISPMAGPTANTRWNPTANRGIPKMAGGGVVKRGSPVYIPTGVGMGPGNPPANPLRNAQITDPRARTQTPLAPSTTSPTSHYAYNPFQPAPGIGGYGPTYTNPQGGTNMVALINAGQMAKLPEGERASATNPHATAWNYQTQPGYNQAVYGGAGGGGTPAAQDGTAAADQGNMGGFTDILFDPWAAFQATTASRNLPSGVVVKQWPWESNLTEFLQAPTQVQDARLAAWRQAGVIAGETPSEMMASAMQMMSRSAPLGTARAMVGYR